MTAAITLNKYLTRDPVRQGVSAATRVREYSTVYFCGTVRGDCSSSIFRPLHHPRPNLAEPRKAQATDAQVESTLEPKLCLGLTFPKP